jgi:ABC-type uncharacterized transport system substrate-binding protein
LKVSLWLNWNCGKSFLKLFNIAITTSAMRKIMRMLLFCFSAILMQFTFLADAWCQNYRIAFVYNGATEDGDKTKNALLQLIQKHDPARAPYFFFESAKYGEDKNTLAVSLAKLDSAHPTLIFASTAHIAQAAVDAKLKSPLVFMTYSDFSSLQVASALRSPDRNATGVNGFVGLEQKRLELLTLLPNMKKIGVLLDRTEPTAIRLEREVKIFAAANPKFFVEKFWVASNNEMVGIEKWLKSRRFDGLYVPQHGAFVKNRAALVSLIDASKVAAIYESNGFVKAGGLMAYETDLSELQKHLAKIIVQVATGTPPNKIPIVIPEGFNFILNLDAVKKLSTPMSQDLLSRVNKFVYTDSALKTTAEASAGAKTHLSR